MDADPDLDAFLRQLLDGDGPTNEPALGDVLGDRYRLTQVIGRGGMGTVYRSVDLHTQDRVAVKVLRAAEDPMIRRRFEREARAAGRLQHRHIVRVLDHGESCSGPFLVMELLEGETLQARLERVAQLPWRELGDLARELGSALSAAHREGVVHRDVKPANVFLARVAGEVVAKLLDFGILKDVTADEQQVTRSDVRLGTVAYMAPEQVRGPRGVGPAADQYALAAVLYRAATGRLPHPGRDAEQVLLAKLSLPPPELREHRPDAPPRWNDGLSRALAIEPSDRFGGVGAFVASLQSDGG